MGDPLSAGVWRVVGASVAGTAHGQAGTPCADAWDARVLPGGWLLAVAADGAGSASRGGEGARLACAAVVERASAQGASHEVDQVLEWLRLARARLARAAQAASLGAREFSCTLLVALAGPDVAVFAQVGDGAIVYRDADGGLSPGCWPQTGEYANSTFFLTDDDALERVQTLGTAAVDELALLTDGLQGLALRFDTRAVHAPFFEPMFAELREQGAAVHPQLARELGEFLASAPVNARTDDDKTLVLATRLGPHGS